MAATTMMHIRIDEDIKAKAAQTLDELGLSISDAVRIFLKRVVVEEGLPLTLKVPNERTRAAIMEAEAITETRFANAGEVIRAIEETVGTPEGESPPQE